MAALVVQVVTGLWLASIRLGGLQNIVNLANPDSRLVAAKLGLLAATLVQAGYAYHRILPRLDGTRLRLFAIHAWTITVLAVLMILAGASIRLGGLT